jgi:hypothetical protein
MLLRAGMPSQIPPRKGPPSPHEPLISSKEFQKWDAGTQSRDELVWEQEFRSGRIENQPGLSEIAGRLIDFRKIFP